jgi:hypothetical protein
MSHDWRKLLIVKALQGNGQLAFLDAALCSPHVITDGMPDAVLFKNRLGKIIRKRQCESANGEPRKIRVFGEMVSLLYMAGNTPAAARLEEFWRNW